MCCCCCGVSLRTRASGRGAAGATLVSLAGGNLELGLRSRAADVSTTSGSFSACAFALAAGCCLGFGLPLSVPGVFSGRVLVDFSDDGIFLMYLICIQIVLLRGPVYTQTTNEATSTFLCCRLPIASFICSGLTR